MTVELYPAIDLRGGKVVRLLQGDYAQETVYGDDPIAVALSFVEAGATWIHIVDLDAARTGEAINRRVVADVARQFEVSTSLTAGSGLAWIWQESSTGLRGSSFESRHARDLKLRNSAVAGASGWLGHLRRQTLYLQRRRGAWVMQFIIHCEVATSDKSRWGFA